MRIRNLLEKINFVFDNIISILTGVIWCTFVFMLFSGIIYQTYIIGCYVLAMMETNIQTNGLLFNNNSIFGVINSFVNQSTRPYILFFLSIIRYLGGIEKLYVKEGNIVCTSINNVLVKSSHCTPNITVCYENLKISHYLVQDNVAKVIKSKNLESALQEVYPEDSWDGCHCISNFYHALDCKIELKSCKTYDSREKKIRVISHFPNGTSVKKQPVYGNEIPSILC